MEDNMSKNHILNCPHCNAGLDVALDKWIQVDAPNLPFKLFCSWKCLGRWVVEVYEQGRQFEEGLEER